MPNTAPGLAVPTRYTRSIHIVRDYASSHVGVRDYQVTPLVLQTTARIAEGLKPESTARSFSVIGPYGSGKSAFGVFLAHYLKSDARMRQRLVAELSTDGIPVQSTHDGPMLLPVLVSGNNESLRRALLRGLQRTFDAMSPLRDGRLRLPRSVDAAADKGDRHSNNTIPNSVGSQCCVSQSDDCHEQHKSVLESKDICLPSQLIRTSKDNSKHACSI
jgi:hypothetical protein